MLNHSSAAFLTEQMQPDLQKQATKRRLWASSKEDVYFPELTTHIQKILWSSTVSIQAPINSTQIFVKIVRIETEKCTYHECRPREAAQHHMQRSSSDEKGNHLPSLWGEQQCLFPPLVSALTCQLRKKELVRGWGRLCQ